MCLFSKEVDDLKLNLEKSEFTAPLLNVNFEYGFNTNHLRSIVRYWSTEYDWSSRQQMLNSVPQFRTQISGLYIHYIHVKPSTVQHPKKMVPLLLLHGWPGSVKEFFAVFDKLTTPQTKYDFVFEVIAPSLPGYGFSDAATVAGLDTAHMALLMKKLMNRLGFHKFYVQGGDWGAIIATDIATLYPTNVLGLHSNMCNSPFTAWSFVKLAVGSFWPHWLVSDEKFQKRLFPLSDMFSYLIEETGYLHLQATKPDTIGVALRNSAAGLAAYILEKFSTWVNFEYRHRKDGGLALSANDTEKNYFIDDLLDNVMIYWITGSITTSMRLYSENMGRIYRNMKLEYIRTFVPTVCSAYPYDLLYVPESLLKQKYANLLYLNHMPKGGHFAAFEEPTLFSQDLWKAVCYFEKGTNAAAC